MGIASHCLFFGFLTATVEEAMYRARYAESLEGNAQGPASAIDAHCHVVRGDA